MMRGNAGYATSGWIRERLATDLSLREEYELRFERYVRREGEPPMPIATVSLCRDARLPVWREVLRGGIAAGVDPTQVRIPLPRSGQQLWAQHKYSVMARSPRVSREFGRRLAQFPVGSSWSELAGSELALELEDCLREPVAQGGAWNALQHMWGYVREVSRRHGEVGEQALAQRRSHELLVEIARWGKHSPYLWHSTALSDLAPFAE